MVKKRTYYYRKPTTKPVKAKSKIVKDQKGNNVKLTKAGIITVPNTKPRDFDYAFDSINKKVVSVPKKKPVQTKKKTYTLNEIINKLKK